MTNAVFGISAGTVASAYLGGESVKSKCRVALPRDCNR